MKTIAYKLAEDGFISEWTCTNCNIIDASWTQCSEDDFRALLAELILKLDIMIAEKQFMSFHKIEIDSIISELDNDLIESCAIVVETPIYDPNSDPTLL